MGKINKHANLYDKDGNLIRSVNDEGILEDYTIPELEKLVDELSKQEDKQTEYNNALRVLISMYNTKQGREYQKKVIDSLMPKKSDSEQAVEKLKLTMKDLQEVAQEVAKDAEEPTYNTNTNEAEYVEYEPAA